MKTSEMFEGEESSLRKTFDGVLPSEVDEAVRDICELPYRSKSEVREILEKREAEVREEIVKKLRLMQEVYTHSHDYDRGYAALSDAIAIVLKVEVTNTP